MLQQIRNWHFNKAPTSTDCHWPHALNWRVMNLQSHASVLISRSERHFIMRRSCLRFWLQLSSRASQSSEATDHNQDEEMAPSQRHFCLYFTIYFPARPPKWRARIFQIYVNRLVICLVMEIHQECFGGNKLHTKAVLNGVNSKGGQKKIETLKYRDI